MEDNIFDSKEHASKYIEMLRDYDNSFVISKFSNYISRDLKILELGMGPALDYENLREKYDITVSDTSTAFIEMFNEKYNEAALNICIKDIEVDETYDCIYTNKVLQVLTDAEMKESFINQYRTLNDDGIIFHCIWIGDGYEECTSNYTSISKLKEMTAGLFTIEEIITYSEMEEGDSIILIARKLSPISR